MRKAKIGIIIFVVLITFGFLIGIVGFHYPQVIENEPFNSPIKVIDMKVNKLFLADGKIIQIDNKFKRDWEKVLSESEFMVDLKFKKDLFFIYARQKSWICGTPWAQPIRIPLFKDIVYENRIELIAVGKQVTDESQQKN